MVPLWIGFFFLKFFYSNDLSSLPVYKPSSRVAKYPRPDFVNTFHRTKNHDKFNWKCKQTNKKQKKYVKLKC